MAWSASNSPYREYVRAWVEEECTLFDFDGIRFDMTFWPAVCYCEYCKKRFADEVGGEIPTTVNWLDERWVAFQRSREAWLGEFAAIATDTVQKLSPAASVEHQASTFPASWVAGRESPAGAEQRLPPGRLLRRLLAGLVRPQAARGSHSRTGPSASRRASRVELADHTAMKSEALLEAKAAAAIADSAAFIFIDAIDPIGTLNPKVYDRMGRIFDRFMPYYRELGGTRVADVAVYYSLDSKFDFAGNGRPVERCRHHRRPHQERRPPSPGPSAAITSRSRSSARRRWRTCGS